MEALRLIKTARHALAEARDVADVLAEARQAALLTEAVGARLAELEEPDDDELVGLGQQLAEAGSHAAGCLDQPVGESPALAGLGAGGRAARLTELGALVPMLAELDGLLRDAGETLVVLACGAETESLYWTCIDGVDAAAECKDLVGRLGAAVRRAAEDGDREAAGTSAADPPPRPPQRPAEAPLVVVTLGPPTGPSAARAPDDCRSARSAVTEASSSCSCSNRLFGVAGAVDGSVADCCCDGRADASDRGSDMSGPLRIGSAV
ncbi:DUF6099 family protein [Kitasatospora sp. CM 4170]|uniref:DUF6099 family protein n=1 Tax=Kitasatospora aburaviensis TaxID=67265 RepID=A0ABW1EUU7_9ACTN|nr:DUF6099 family protein [Kitasatospora sp. CM 4170]WNM45801.1 DUF6099 family protein [Kitasatospora sp. CM 4170]